MCEELQLQPKCTCYHGTLMNLSEMSPLLVPMGDSSTVVCRFHT